MAPPTEPVRPLLVDVAEHPPFVRVALEIRGLPYTGEARVGPGEATLARVAAAAWGTLQALDDATPAAVGLRLESSDVVTLEDSLPPLVVVLCAVTVAELPLRIPGAVLLRDQPVWAGARAVLQGLNRRLEILGL